MVPRAFQHSEPGREEPAALGELDRSLVRGIAWTGTVKWCTQLLSWAAALVIARLLSPADYGLVGMAMVYLGLAHLINEFGLSAAIVQRRHLTEEQVARLGGLSVAFGVGWTALSVLLARPVAAFFGEPAVRWVITLLATTFLAKAFQVLPRSLLTKELRFARLAWLDGAEALTQTAVTLALALLGFGYWSLVLGGMSGALMTCALAVAWRPHRLAWPAPLKPIAGEIAFGWHFLGAQLTWYAYSNADFAIIGRVLGSKALGAYTLGWHMANVPVERLSALVSRVAPPVLAAVQHQQAALRRYFARLTEGLALLTFPAAVGLALVADEFVLVVLGEHWRPAIAPLRLLALYGGFRSIVTLPPLVLAAIGQPRRTMQFNMLLAVTLPALFLAGTRWGVTGVALVWVFCYPLVVIPSLLRYTLRVINMSWAEYVRALLPAMNGTVLMAAVVLVVRAITPEAWPLPMRLVTHAGWGAVTYAGLTMLWHGRRVQTVLALVRGASR